MERRISDIRKELDAAEQESSKLHNQALDSIKQIKESQVIEALGKIKDLGEDCYYLKDLNETLKLKEGKSMEALNKAHKAILEDVSFQYLVAIEKFKSFDLSVDFQK